jgi:hypothetical protein
MKNVVHSILTVMQHHCHIDGRQLLVYFTTLSVTRLYSVDDSVKDDELERIW